MVELTKRERVLRTTRFQETDRVPVYDLLQNDATIEHYSGQKLTIENGDRVTRLAIGHAFDMTRSPFGPKGESQYRNDEGMLISQERWQGWITQRPFDNANSAVSWIKEQIKRVNSIKLDASFAAQFHQYVTDCLVTFAETDPTGRHDPAVLVIESGVGLTEMYTATGLELFSYLLVDEPELVDEWLEARNQAELRRVALIARPDLIPIVLTYDDIAFKTQTLFSPTWLRAHYFPRLKRLNTAWKTRDTLCLYHSDGNLWRVMDDLVDAGIDGLNPLETMAGMTVKEVRQRYPTLFLTGGIDVSHLLTFGSPDEVRAVCRQTIEDAGGSGYFLGSTTELHWDVKVENVIAMVETAWGSKK